MGKSLTWQTDVYAYGVLCYQVRIIFTIVENVY
jgi:hypothetical protein